MSAAILFVSPLTASSAYDYLPWLAGYNTVCYWLCNASAIERRIARISSHDTNSPTNEVSGSQPVSQSASNLLHYRKLSFTGDETCYDHKASTAAAKVRRYGFSFLCKPGLRLGPLTSRPTDPSNLHLPLPNRIPASIAPLPSRVFCESRLLRTHSKQAMRWLADVILL